jgi:hypothetical protein
VVLRHAARVQRRTVAGPREEERTLVKLVPILHISAVDLGCHAAGVEKGSRIYGGPFAPIQIFGWLF